MATKNGFSLSTVLAAFFCILGSIGAGLSLKTMAPHLGGWMSGFYILIAALFLAVSAVILIQVLSAVEDN